ncbi:hypothetical protein BXY66_3272 [Shimia isoporae]|uniref:Uncharacterized protein n=1 Tax=Shimia isoporae TaxID=647720 RepID=A0A4R1N4J0_9RHOB|nr:hypothetical protein [Shimia isoporae]TCL00625.1 hypothetical protein BXY66_3272 [Shimia isoporae]
MNRRPSPGARRVGWLSDLAPAERMAVRCLRACGRPAGADDQLNADLAMRLGPARGRVTREVLDELMHCARAYGRRPLCRHACNCDCLGADEAVFAALVGHAVHGELEETAQLSSLIVRPDMARNFAGLITEFGFAMDVMTRNAAAQIPQTHGVQAVVH